MTMISRETLESLRERYLPGSRVILHSMVDDPDSIPPGTTGRLDCIDDAGHFHTQWNNGRYLAAIYGVDQFDVTPPNPPSRDVSERPGTGKKHRPVR